MNSFSFRDPEAQFAVQATAASMAESMVEHFPGALSALSGLNLEETLDPTLMGSAAEPHSPPGLAVALDPLVDAALAANLAMSKAALLNDESMNYHQMSYFSPYWQIATELDYMMQMSNAPHLSSYMAPMGTHSGAHTFPSFERASTSVPREAATTLMLRNIPQRYNREMLLEDIDARGFRGTYDFFYLPIDFATIHSVGYAFINFVGEAEPVHFKSVYDGLKLSEDSPKVCEVCDAKVQGRVRNVEFYRNSTVMGMDEQYHPVLLENGFRLRFPQPTRVLGPVQKRLPRAGGHFKQQ